MKAYVLQRYGGPSAIQLREVSEPICRPDEVLIEVHAAGLNPVDYKFRQGMLRPIYRPHLPFLMGNELAGVVVRCGDAVHEFREGDRVFACTGVRSSGAWAERAAVPSSLVAKMPDGLAFESAAGVPLAGLTALQCLRDECQLVSQDTILITGGAGGVGTLAIQIARAMNAEVVTTASPRGEKLVRDLGANEVIDYTRQSLSDTRRTFRKALDLVGGKTLRELFSVMERGGSVVSIAGTPEPRTATDLNGGAGLRALFWAASIPVRWQAYRHGVDYRYYFMQPSGEDLQQITKLIEEGRLRPIIDRTYPFAQLPEALAYLEEGHAKGKVVVSRT